MAALAVVTLLWLGSATVALVHWTVVDGYRGCPLGLEFERSSATVISERAYPPRVECEYTYEAATDETLDAQETVAYNAAPTTAAAGAIGAVWLVLGLSVWRTSVRPSYPT